MKKWRTSGGTDIWQVLRGRSNAYLLCRDGRYLLVDTGRKKSCRRLCRNIETLGVSKDSSFLLVLTHTHFDHAENAACLKKKYGAQVVVHEDEADFLGKGSSPLPGGTLPVLRFIMGRVHKLLQPLFRYDPVLPDYRVSEFFDLQDHGFEGRLLAAPGHSRGSMAVIIENEIAMVGDGMFGIFSKSILPPFGDDTALMKKSWSLLFDTGCVLYLPGHGRVISRERVRGALPGAEGIKQKSCEEHRS